MNAQRNHERHSVQPFPPAKAEFIAAKVVEQCDGLDGLPDGIAHNQAECRFNPFDHVCPPNRADGCLTVPEAKTASDFYAPLTLNDGTVLHEGWGPGGEDLAWPVWLIGPQYWQSFFGDGLVKYWLARDQSFDSLNFDPNVFRRQIDETAALLDASPDLYKFFAKGGKLIMVSGTHDWAVSHKETIKYFGDVGAAAGEALRDANMEFFLLPGVQHCGGGAGPGQADLLEASVNWAEAGRRPSEQGIALTSDKISRPLCRYPSFASYQGGDTSSASSFLCK